MRKLEPTIVNCDSNYTETVVNKYSPRREVLQRIQPRVIQRYKEYELFTRDLNALLSSGGFSATEREALVHCYDSPVSPFRELKMKIRENQSVRECQYCCVNRATTLDHYLPKEHFAEFSIYPLNLIPCCGDCNNAKGSKLTDSANNRMFINFFYEDDAVFSGSQFLFARLDYDGQVPVATYFLQNDGTFSARQFRVIENHFAELKLLQLYREYSNVKITRSQETMASLYSSLPGVDVSSQLATEANIVRRLSGTNHWEAALLDSLSSSDHFVDSCKTISVTN